MTTLILIDLQHGMCHPEGAAGAAGLADAVAAAGVLDHAAQALDAAREAGLDVVHVRLAFPPGHGNRTNATERFRSHATAGRFVLGEADTEFSPQVAPRRGETVLEKGSVSPFASTALLAMLTARGERDLVLAGVATHLAVESAAREAADRGFEVRVLGQACTAPSAQIHQQSLDVGIASFATVMETDAFCAGLASRGTAEKGRA